MKLDDEVIEVLREERSRKGRARLAVCIIRQRVTAKRRKEQPILVWIFGPLWEFIFAPSDTEVHDAIQQLKSTHENLVSDYSYGRGVTFPDHEVACEN